MKYSLLILITLFILSGCTVKQSEVSIETSKISKKEKSESESIEESLENNEPIIKMDDAFKVALLFPSKVVGKYAKDNINTILSYLLHNNIKFEFEVFDSNTEDIENIQNSLDEIVQSEIKNVIVLYTKNSLDKLFSLKAIDDLNIYMPLINKNDSTYNYNNVIYGGIDYKEQINRLLTLSNKRNAIFYSNNNLGFYLKDFVENSEQFTTLSTVIDKNNNEYKRIVNNNKLNSSTLFLNTPIIKSSILLSQLRAYETVPYLILSTQLNYTPLIISLTQYQDRKNLIVANSISKIDYKLQESLFLLDTDVSYNWVNYSTLIGIDSIFNKEKSIYFPNKIENNQVKYEIELLKSTRDGFKKTRRN